MAVLRTQSLSLLVAKRHSSSGPTEVVAKITVAILQHGLPFEQEDAIVAWKTSPLLSLAQSSRQVDEERDARRYPPVAFSPQANTEEANEEMASTNRHCHWKQLQVAYSKSERSPPVGNLGSKKQNLQYCTYLFGFPTYPLPRIAEIVTILLRIDRRHWDFFSGAPFRLSPFLLKKRSRRRTRKRAVFQFAVRSRGFRRFLCVRIVAWHRREHVGFASHDHCGRSRLRIAPRQAASSFQAFCSRFYAHFDSFDGQNERGDLNVKTTQTRIYLA